jgi:hypothetical protein
VTDWYWSTRWHLMRLMYWYSSKQICFDWWRYWHSVMHSRSMTPTHFHLVLLMYSDLPTNWY